MKGFFAWTKTHYKPLLCAALFVALSLFLLSFAAMPDEIAIEATLDENSHTLQVEQTIRYVNRTQFPMDSLYLHLYANAFAEKKSAPVLKNEYALCYPNGFSEGGATVQSLTVDGEEASFFFDEAQPTLLQIVPTSPLSPGRAVEISLSYALQLPNTRLRFGYSDRDIRLLNAFAIPAWHDGSAWHLDAYSAVGDPFVSTVADYNVTLHAPTSYVVAGPGLQGSGEDGTWRFRARDVREFALTLSKDYHVSQSEGGGMTVRAFAFSQEAADEMAEIGARAAEVFSGLFGALDQEELLLCAGEFALGGMEYPSLVLLDDNLTRADDGMLEFVIAHETAHQWWYAAVGSDQVNHPWQDEALTEYSTLLYYEATYGRESMESLYRGMIRPALERADIQGVSMDQPITAFETNAFYDALVYRKGAAMWHDVRALMGNDSFLKALRRYHLDNAGQIASPKTLLQALGREGSERALQWISGEETA